MTTASSENDLVLERLSDLMLRGWIMTNDTCYATTHSAPKMRMKGGTEHWCVLCDEDKIVANGGGVIKSRTRAQATTTEQQAAAISTEIEEETKGASNAEAEKQQDTEYPEQSPISTRRARQDDVSRLLGEKMLQGWTLMESVCESNSCVGVPLMKDLQGRLYCVACQKTVDELAEMDVNMSDEVSHYKFKENNGNTTLEEKPSNVNENITRHTFSSDATTTELTPSKRIIQSTATMLDTQRQQKRQVSYADFTTFSDDEVLAKTQYTLKVTLGRQLHLLEQCESSHECATIANAVSNLVMALKACKQ
ncbi:hypothetical protein BDF22DRAFT_744917 [Syncephalis plumigaleata]|nr:hypothetical protein BDF22DRAFT_744917 [Syncephalis plumigaleata]